VPSIELQESSNWQFTVKIKYLPYGENLVKIDAGDPEIILLKGLFLKRNGN